MSGVVQQAALPGLRWPASPANNWRACLPSSCSSPLAEPPAAQPKATAAASKHPAGEENSSPQGGAAPCQAPCKVPGAHILLSALERRGSGLIAAVQAKQRAAVAAPLREAAGHD